MKPYQFYFLTVLLVASWGLANPAFGDDDERRLAPPVAVPDTFVAIEDQQLRVRAVEGVLINDMDPDGDDLTTMLVEDAANGTLDLKPGGAFNYTPNPNFDGVDTFTYSAVANGEASAPVTVRIEITPVDDPLIAMDDAYTLNEGTTLTVGGRGVLANDRDPDGGSAGAEPFAILVDDVSNGVLSFNADGAFSYTPDRGFIGVDMFTYRASDGTVTTDVVTVTLTVRNLNDVPEAIDDTYTGQEGRELKIQRRDGILENDSDPDGDGLTAVLITSVSNGTLTVFNDVGSFTYVPNPGFTGTDQFTYRASDGQGLSNIATVRLIILDVNDGPTANDDQFLVSEDGTLAVSAPGVLGNDVDPDGDRLQATLTRDVRNGQLVLSSSGGFSYVPDPDFNGSDTFLYEASDGTVNSRSATVTITVIPTNDPPTALGESYRVNEDDTLNINPNQGVLSNDTDPDGDVLTARLVQDVQNGILVLSTDGSFTYIPAPDFSGTDSFLYLASDGRAQTVPVNVTLTVTSVNDRPIGIADSYIILEDSILTVDAANGVLSNDGDPEGEVLTARLRGRPQNGNLTLNSDGSFIYEPDPDFNGTDQFGYVANDGSSNSDSVVVTLSVTAVNDVPIAGDDTYAVVEEDTLFVPISEGLLSNDSDAEGDALLIVIVDSVDHGTMILTTDGSFIYTPDPDFFGVDSLTYQVDDGTVLSDTALVEIVVSGVNDVPVAQGDAFTLNEDGTLLVPASQGLRRNDVDADGDELTTIMVDSTDHGAITFRPDGSFTYRPTPNYNGEDRFTYYVADGDTTEGVPTVSNVVAVTLTIRPTNDVPVPVTDQYRTGLQEPISVPAPGVLENDVDIDGDELRAELVRTAEHGVLSLQPNGSFTYTPEEGFEGTEVFAYRARDDSSASDGVAVRIRVGAVNALPVAQPDTSLTDLTTPVVVYVLDNDSDPDGDSLFVSSVTEPEAGRVVINADGSLTYIPDGSGEGPIGFQYTVEDDRGGASRAQVVIQRFAFRFTITELGTLGGNGSRAFGINDQGQVVGASRRADGSIHAFLWDRGRMVDLGGADTETSQAYDISEQGETVGLVERNGETVAARWNANLVRQELAMPGVGFAVAFGLNDQGQAVGAAAMEDNQFHAVRWSQLGATDLYPVTGLESQAFDVNDEGRIAGYAEVAEDTALAFVDDVDGTLDFLLDPEAQASRAYDINERGEIVGSRTAEGLVQAAFWDASGAPGGLAQLEGEFSEAYAFNDEGWIVGTSARPGGKRSGDVSMRSNDILALISDSTRAGTVLEPAAMDLRATFWVNQVVKDLNNQVPATLGWTLIEARDINRVGQIVGYGLREGQQRAFILSPTTNVWPLAEADAARTPAGAQVVIDVLANDLDADGDTLAVLDVTPGEGGAVVNNRNGTVSYTPHKGFRGDDVFRYSVHDGRGGISEAEVVVTVEEVVPRETVLHQNYPNPFNPSTLIRYELAEDVDVMLDVYNPFGQQIAVLVDEPQSSGTYTVTFEAYDLASGVYVYRLRAGDVEVFRKLVVVK